MALPLTKTSLNKAQKEINLLLSYVNSSRNLEAKYQYFIAEIVLLRLFSILESTIAELSFKLACNASYSNSRSPILLVPPCKSILAAENLMRTKNRTHPPVYLKWTSIKGIRDSIKHVLDVQDTFMGNAIKHGPLIDEMRIVRNHIAHRNSSTYQKYKGLIRNKFGANKRISVGGFLLSARGHNRNNLNTYLSSASVILSDLASGI